MNEEIIYKVNTKVLKKAINDKYGSIPNFAAQTKYNKSSIYNWFKSEVISANILFEMAEVLSIDDLNTLRKKEIIYSQI
ncbi:hypothetical protein [Romboutsia sp.]|uniref:hypothetical protein n=1 Tax=Romboutsia sp. TaxID=1965302 RepID=UPI003F3FC843